ncbi:hypothetical protein SAMN05445060_1931 [Williamsia sterculiae]|uniref:Uncharacterized protein n=1 Tax=Williamsia sterculiae TaxID=1344003 RepID=A0A1N7FCM1_9NOCA|nr:hypothetical protein SAMN05445060_1931 [Williamsia sterculiae]
MKIFQLLEGLSPPLVLDFTLPEVRHAVFDAVDAETVYRAISAQFCDSICTFWYPHP